MDILIGLFVGAALLITLAATVVTDVQMWRLFRESREKIRALPPERRRVVHFEMVAMPSFVIALAAVVIIAPFGVRNTLTYFVILPVVVLVPVALIATGVRGFRGQRGARRPHG